MFEANGIHVVSASEGNKTNTNQIIEGQICLIIIQSFGNFFFIFQEASLTFCSEDGKFVSFIPNTSVTDIYAIPSITLT